MNIGTINKRMYIDEHMDLGTINKRMYIDEYRKHIQRHAQIERASKRVDLQREICHSMASHTVTPPEYHRE